MSPAATRPRLRATCCAAATYFRIRPSLASLGLFDGPHPWWDRADGIPSKSEYPGEARPGTLPNSYFMTGQTAGAFLIVRSLPAIFHPQSDILSGFSINRSPRIPRERKRLLCRHRRRRCVDTRSPSPLDVCRRFYDVCRPRGPLLLFITTDVSVTLTRPA